MEEEAKCVIKWRSKTIGKEGCGEPMDKEVALAWVDDLNERWPDFEHWIEEVK